MIRTKGGSTYFRSVEKQNHLVVDVGLDDRSMLYIYMLIITILTIFINDLTKLFDFQGGYLVIPKQHTLIELHE
jgi:membrane-bound acyltransferase YfiQ involved in biofilm formation